MILYSMEMPCPPVGGPRAEHFVIKVDQFDREKKHQMWVGWKNSDIKNLYFIFYKFNQGPFFCKHPNF